MPDSFQSRIPSLDDGELRRYVERFHEYRAEAVEAAAKARADWAACAEEFAQKSLHQKAEVLKLTVLETRENVVLVQAEGQLVRTGVVRDQTFTEAPAFTARFTFARNPNLAVNGRYPLAVWKYDLSF